MSLLIEFLTKFDSLVSDIPPEIKNLKQLIYQRDQLYQEIVQLGTKIKADPPQQTMEARIECMKLLQRAAQKIGGLVQHDPEAISLISLLTLIPATN